MKRAIAMNFSLLILLSLPIRAAVTDQDFATLKADLMVLVERVNSLETENLKLRRSINQEIGQLNKLTKSSSAGSWADDVKWKGDFRYRYEGIRVEDQDRQASA